MQDDNNTSLLEEVRREFEDLKGIAEAFGPSKIKDGTWFNEFIKAMLGSYSTRIIEGGGVEFYRKKYPGLTQNQIAERLCDLATRYATLAGGASGLTASTAVAATIGTGAGAVTVPAAIAAVSAEVLFTTRLQVRLVYDLSQVYGYPLNLDDPEDLYRAFSLAYGVTYASGQAGAVAKVLTPEIARAQIRALIHGHQAFIQHVARAILGPRIGRMITQKAILRTAVPVVGVGISSGWNYLSTSQIASVARHEIRSQGRLRDAACELAPQLRGSEDNTRLVLESILCVGSADGKFDDHEQQVFRSMVQHLDARPELLAAIESRVDVNPDSVAERLGLPHGDDFRVALAKLLVLVAASDGTIAPVEAELLRRYLAALKQSFDLVAAEAEAASFRRGATFTDTATQAASSTVAWASRGVSSSFRTLSGLFGKAKQPVEPTSVEPETVPAEELRAQGAMDRLQRLGALHAQGLISNEEFNTKRADIIATL